MEENKQTETQTKPDRGGISVEIEHIFPIIKKWLYSEKEIFLRELVSNACDAVTKLRRLISLGETEQVEEPFSVTVTLDAPAGTLTISDNGIGMTEQEVRRYICQIALSGALEFVQKYEGDAANDGIIGHFGLGFYSAFMVADRVELFTRSYTGAPAVHWSCDDNGSYEITPAEHEQRGTDVVLHITQEEKEFLNATRLREILEKYCAFMPVQIYFVDVEAQQKEAAEKQEKQEKQENSQQDAQSADTEQAPEKEEPQPINDTHPLWQKAPSECTEQEYKDFYHKVFHDYRDPLFYIHISADYPLNFKGILYFPKINHEYESLEGQVKLYYNQVFVADNIKEVIPEFLLMLRGVLDCPELPLNVSRSYLQNNGYVAKISAHIVKKVADKLCGMFTNDRKQYEQLWDDLSAFVEYGSLRERKFFDRVKNAVLLRTTATGDAEDARQYVTLEEYLQAAKQTNENTVYYTTDPTAQAQYIAMFRAQGIEIVVLPHVLDTQFITLLEQDHQGVKFVRIDADVASALCEDGDAAENETVTAAFRKAAGQDTLKVVYRKLKDAGIPALLNVSEESRRMADMLRMYQPGGAEMPQEASLVVNTQSPLIEKLSTCADTEKGEQLARQIYALAQLSQRQLTATELQDFLKNSYTLLEQL